MDCSTTCISQSLAPQPVSDQSKGSSYAAGRNPITCSAVAWKSHRWYFRPALDFRAPTGQATGGSIGAGMIPRSCHSSIVQGAQPKKAANSALDASCTTRPPIIAGSAANRSRAVISASARSARRKVSSRSHRACSSRSSSSRIRACAASIVDGRQDNDVMLPP